MNIRSNLTLLHERIARAAERSGRDPSTIELVVVTKTVGVDEIREAIECGVSVIGESRVQEAAAKKGEIGHPVQWHMIGHLQSRKAGHAVNLFDMIHSVESLSTAVALEKKCAQAGRMMPILIEVNTSEEPQKYGISPDGARSFVHEVVSMQHLRIKGLMTMAAFMSDPELARPSFRRLRELAARFREENIEGADFDILSMGMSNDFEVAIEEGSTMVRIGTAVFSG